MDIIKQLAAAGIDVLGFNFNFRGKITKVKRSEPKEWQKHGSVSLTIVIPGKVKGVFLDVVWISDPSITALSDEQLVGSFVECTVEEILPPAKYTHKPSGTERWSSMKFKGQVRILDEKNIVEIAQSIKAERDRKMAELLKSI